MTKLISPAPSGMAGLPFGSAKSPYTLWKRHKGKDWKWLTANPVGSKVTVAPVGGTVTTAFNDGGYHNEFGNYVDIQVTRSVKVRLAHHATGSVRVRVGQKVNAGDRIGTMGSTGKATGDHLHEELWIDGVRVNPDTYRGSKGKHLPGTPVPASTGDAYTRTQVVLTGLNLRKSPKTGKVTTVIPEGTVVKTGNSSAGWTPVKYGTRTGWVASEYLRLRTRTVKKAGLWLRTEPGGKAKATLKKGAKVTVLAVNGEKNTSAWVKVEAGGRTGWVLGKYLG